MKREHRELYIGCIDARRPLGELNVAMGNTYVLRTIGAFVPSGDKDMEEALRFAIDNGIRTITVAAHTDCGAAGACMSQHPGVPHVLEYLRPLDAVRSSIDPGGKAPLRELERKIAQESLRNLMTYDCVKQAVDAGRLSLRGWLVDIGDGGRQHDITHEQHAPKLISETFPPHNPKKIFFGGMDPSHSVRKQGIGPGESFIARHFSMPVPADKASVRATLEFALGVKGVREVIIAVDEDGPAVQNLAGKTGRQNPGHELEKELLAQSAANLAAYPIMKQLGDVRVSTWIIDEQGTRHEVDLASVRKIPTRG